MVTVRAARKSSKKSDLFSSDISFPLTSVFGKISHPGGKEGAESGGNPLLPSLPENDESDDGKNQREKG
jgi:hypothetical protein